MGETARFSLKTPSPLITIQLVLMPSTTKEFLADQARAFLVDRVVEQAAREQAPLSDIETRMLSFSKDGPEADYRTFDAFSEKYNTQEYEERVAGLVQRAREHDRDEDKASQWREALRAVCGMDFYLLSIINRGEPQVSKELRQKEQKEVVWFLVLILAVGVYIWLRLAQPHEAWARWILIVLAAFAYGFKIGRLWRNRW